MIRQTPQRRQFGCLIEQWHASVQLAEDTGTSNLHTVTGKLNKIVTCLISSSVSELYRYRYSTAFRFRIRACEYGQASGYGNERSFWLYFFYKSALLKKNNQAANFCWSNSNRWTTFFLVSPRVSKQPGIGSVCGDLQDLNQHVYLRQDTDTYVT